MGFWGFSDLIVKHDWILLLDYILLITVCKCTHIGALICTLNTHSTAHIRQSFPSSCQCHGRCGCRRRRRECPRGSFSLARSFARTLTTAVTTAGTLPFWHAALTHAPLCRRRRSFGWLWLALRRCWLAGADALLFAVAARLSSTLWARTFRIKMHTRAQLKCQHVRARVSILCTIRHRDCGNSIKHAPAELSAAQCDSWPVSEFADTAGRSRIVA